MLQKQCDFLFKKFLAAEPRYFILKLMNFCSIHVFTDVTGDVKEKNYKNKLRYDVIKNRMNTNTDYLNRTADNKANKFLREI